jgi:hypothetical protein
VQNYPSQYESKIIIVIDVVYLILYRLSSNKTKQQNTKIYSFSLMSTSISMDCPFYKSPWRLCKTEAAVFTQSHLHLPITSHLPWLPYLQKSIDCLCSNVSELWETQMSNWSNPSVTYAKWNKHLKLLNMRYFMA